MLTLEEVEHVATLARIDLTPEEVASFQTDLSKVLIFFKELESLDTEHVNDMGHITGRVNEARPDQLNEATEITKSLIQKNFPEDEAGYLKVRSVL